MLFIVVIIIKKIKSINGTNYLSSSPNITVSASFADERGRLRDESKKMESRVHGAMGNNMEKEKM